MNVAIKTHAISTATGLVWGLLLITSSEAHDWPVHMRITQAAFNGSSSLSEFLTDNPHAARLTASQTGCEGSFTPTTWLQFGSRLEDEQPYKFGPERTLDHFYTVQPGRTAGGVLGLTDGSEPSWNIGSWLPSGLANSFAWATVPGLSGPMDVGPNLYNWRSARDYQLAALTGVTDANRNENLALMLYALGHILHLNQDTSSPDHVRNDNHFYEAHRYIENYGAKNDSKNPQWFKPQPHGWAYWQAKGFNKVLDFWDRGLYVGDANSLNAGADSCAYDCAKLGLAEFCNGNFLGEDALYKELTYDDPVHHFPYPSLDGTNLKNIQYKLVDGLGLVSAYDVTFLKNGQVANRIFLAKDYPGRRIDHHSVMGYLGVKANPFAGAYGSYLQVNAALSVNDSKVLQEYHDILVPKAIEYSTGILDYFFRGRIEATILWDDINNKYRLRVINRSGESVKGGTFSLFYDDVAGTRHLVIAVPYTGTLAADTAIDLEFDNTAIANQKCTLVYRGNIGITGTTASDLIDADFAIAVTTFQAPPAVCSHFWYQFIVQEISPQWQDYIGAVWFDPSLYWVLEPPASPDAGFPEALQNAEATLRSLDFESPPSPWPVPDFNSQASICPAKCDQFRDEWGAWVTDPGWCEPFWALGNGESAPGGPASGFEIYDTGYSVGDDLGGIHFFTVRTVRAMRTKLVGYSQVCLSTRTIGGLNMTAKDCSSVICSPAGYIFESYEIPPDVGYSVYRGAWLLMPCQDCSCP